MRLPASGKARFGLGFWPIAGFFVLANLVTLAAVPGPTVDFVLKIRAGFNLIGFPYHFWDYSSDGGYPFFNEFTFAFDVVICFLPASLLGFILFKFGDPNRWLGYLCKGCGYDLRGLPSRVCPECGANAQQDDEPADP